MAAVEGQRALAAEPWPEGVEVNVRMGLHAGEASESAAGLVGLDINRAARIAAAAHGGQVVVSDAVRTLVTPGLAGGISLHGLGSHRLKDLREPQPLCQVVADGLRMEFPPLRSLDARPNNLPTQLTSFVGRERELAEAGALLAANRLVTLTGPGRHRQDAALAAGRRERGRWLPGRRVLRRARDGARAGPGRVADRVRDRARRDRGARRRRGAPRVARRQARPPRARQLRAGPRRGSDRRRAPARRTRPVRPRDLARAAPRVGRAGVPGSGPADAARPVAADLDGAREPAGGGADASTSRRCRRTSRSACSSPARCR